MNRKEFLGSTALFSLPLFLQGIPVFAGKSAMHPFLQALTSPMISCDRVLVVIQLNGGNDGLNMVIPLDKFSEISAARSRILIPESQVLPVPGFAETGLHPSMKEIQELFGQGKVNIVQGVSYPNPNFSHFQAQDIWFTASNDSSEVNTGWLGRNLEMAYPNYPADYPNAEHPDPPAIQIGGALPLSLHGPNGNVGYNAPDPATLIRLATAVPEDVPDNDYGTEITFLRLMKDQSNSYTTRISAAYNAQQTMSSKYSALSGNKLADQLKVVARLIGGGLQTPVYIVNHPDSFDTHGNQVSAHNSVTGIHSNALAKLSAAIGAFQDDLKLMSKEEKVTGMTFSEFGRRVMSNASIGTDHGTAAPVIFFGAGVKGGITGTSPDLPSNPDSNTQVPMQYDFRQLYATVMQDWMCMTPAQSQAVLNGVHNTIQVFGSSSLPSMLITSSVRLDGILATIDFEVMDNNEYYSFTLERSVDAVTFESINVIQNESDDSRKKYVIQDEKINADNIYYRIKGITKKYGEVFSDVMVLSNGKKPQQLSVYPNPVTNFHINIDFFEEVKEKVEVNIYGTRGEKLYYNQFSLGSSKKINFQVPKIFNSYTIYILKVIFNNTEVSEKIIFAH